MTDEQIGKLIKIILNQAEQVAWMEEREYILHRLMKADEFLNKKKICAVFNWEVDE